MDLFRAAGKTTSFQAYIKSWSMSPVLIPADLICLKKTSIAEIKRGDIISYKKWPGEAQVVHRVVKVKGGPGGRRLITKGDSLLTLDLAEVGEEELVGKVASILRGKNSINLEDGLHHFLNPLLAILSRLNLTPGAFRLRLRQNSSILKVTQLTTRLIGLTGIKYAAFQSHSFDASSLKIKAIRGRKVLGSCSISFSDRTSAGWMVAYISSPQVRTPWRGGRIEKDLLALSREISRRMECSKIIEERPKVEVFLKEERKKWTGRLRPKI